MKLVTIKSREKIPPFAQIVSQHTHSWHNGDFAESEERITLLVPEESEWEFLAKKLEEHNPKKEK